MTTTFRRFSTAQALLSVAALSLAACPADPVTAAPVTPGAYFNTDASLDDDGNGRWEDTTGVSGFDLNLDNSPAVTRVTGTSALPGITAAYDFPGGSTGNEAGALLSIAGAGTQRSFGEAPGDWSNEDVTIEVWFKPDNLTPTPTNGQILFEDGGGTGLGFFVDNNELRLRKEPGVGNVATNISGISSEFVQAVGTYDVSAGSMELFVNGASVGTATPTGNDWSGGDAAGVGTRADANVGGIGSGQASTESFDGQVAIFRVYRNQILSGTQVSDNYNAVLNDAPAAQGPPWLLNYDAGDDDGANGTWENTGVQSGFDITALSGETYENPPAPVTALPGITAAYDFDGSGSGGNLASLDGLPDSEDVSFEMWFRPSDLTGDEILFETGGGTGVGIFLGGGTSPALSGVSDSEVTFSVTQNSLGSQTAFVSGDLSGIDISEFVQVVGTFDIGTDTATLYINGVPIGTATSASGIGEWSGGDGAGLGRLGGANMGGVGSGALGFTNYDGEIGIFRVYPQALTSDQVLAAFNSTTGIPEPATSVLIVLAAACGLVRRRRPRR